MQSEKITISNYRSIPYNNPLTIEIKEGITFILGVNNIGKSNLLKFFYEFRNFPPSSINPFNTYTTYSVDLKNQQNDKILHQKNIDLGLKLEFENEKDKLTFSLKSPVNVNKLSGANSFHFKVEKKDSNGSNKFFLIDEMISKSMYIGSFRNADFENNSKYFDISIGSQFILEWDGWQNGHDTYKRNKIRSLVTEIKDLFDFEHLAIRVDLTKKNLIIENENGSFYLNELGGGLSHFIIVLGNALIKEPSFILIDEPENALHPKLQQTFVRALASKAKYGLYATSHSIGLAKSVADNIYFLSKGSETKRLFLKDYDDTYKSNILNSISELGYSQFIDIGGNNILLVEGRTDIKSFKEILKKYNIEHQFIIMDLGGSNNINGNSYQELEELKRLNANSYSVIFDSEATDQNSELKQDFKDFVSNCEKLGFNVFPTDYHSTENYISQEAIDKCNIGDYKAIDKYDHFESKERKQQGLNWGKSQNWKMFKEMDVIDFKETKLDSFIKETLIPLTKNN